MRKKKILMMLALLCAIVQGTKAQITFPIVYDDVWDGRTTSVPVYYTEYKGHTNVVVIKKASELAYIRDNWREKATYSENTNPYSNLNYYLDANLDLGDAVSWNPIGKGWLDGLTKTFYGANHTIRINIQHEGEEYSGGGLFSRLGTEGVIQDLHVTGIINVGDWRGIGAIVGENLGKIKNCWVSADVISAHYSASNSAALGGIAGQCYGSSSVEYCCMTGNVSNPKNNGVAGIIGEGYGNANHVTFYGTRYNDHSEHDIWVGEQDGTLTNQHADDLNNDATLTSYLGSFSGNDLYRQAIQYSYAVNIKNIGTGIMTSNLERTRPGQTVRLTKASGNSVASVTVKDADSNPITVSGNEMNGWTFTMPQRDVTVTAAFLNDDGTVPDTGMSIDVWNGSSQARPGYFDASSHTIHIQSAAQLIYVYNNWDNEVFSGYDYYECNYILDTDLDMSTKTWKPLGSKAYKGTFNGNGHMIRIKIDDSSISDNGQGLFATIASGSRVENLHVDGKIKVGNARLVGGIAGDNYGTIRNCWVSANVESSHYSSYDADLGGICGLNESDGTVEFCCMTGNVTNTGDNSGVGGLAGSNDGTIQHCTFYGSVSVNHSQDNKYVGEQDETMEDMYDTYDDVHYGYSNGGGNNMYCYAYKYPYSVTVNTMGTGTIRTSAADEYDVPGTYPDATFTLHVTSGSVARFTITNADGNDVPLQGQANDGSSYWFVMPQKNITATFVFYEDWPTQGTGTEEDPYLISSADDWNKFAHNVTYGRNYSGQYVKLTNDISVTTMAGGYQADDNYQPFSGTFDGDGHTLTLNVSNQSRFAAPFKCVSGATIKNLRTAGTINGGNNADGKLLAGIVGVSFGNTTITGCVSSVTLTTAFGTDAALAGLVAGTKGGSLTIEGCVFDGEMLGTTNTRCAGIAGYEYTATTTTITNTLFRPATLTVSTTDDGYTKTFSRDADAIITNSYYTKVLGAAQGTACYFGAATVPNTFGDMVTDYGVVKAYANGLFFNGKYYYSDAGSEENPYIIDSEDALARIAPIVNSGMSDFVGKHFSLICDLDLSGRNWTPIGTTDRPFRGNFNGNNHTISNLTVNNSSGDYNGLFGYVTGVILEPGGNDPGCDYIRNFVVKNANVRGRNYTGGVAGHVLGKLIFENVILDGATVEGADYTSGFIGFAEGIQIWLASMDAYSPLDVQNCLFINGSVTANNAAHIYSSFDHPRSSFVMFGEISTHSFFTSCYFNNVVYNGAAAQEDYYNVQAYPVIVNAPSNINCEFLFAPIYVPGQAVPDNYVSAAGIDYNGNYYIPGTTPFRLSYNDYQYRVTSVKINGVEVGTNIGEYVLNAGGSPIDSYTVTVECEPGLTGSGTEDDPYLITSTELWDWFAFTVSLGRNYSGKFVRLDADIDISTTVGLRGDKPFSGTFLGDGHTLTTNISSTTTGTGVNEQGVAPFHYINGATIKDLTVAGTIASASYHTSGLVGFADGTNLIENCAVTATLNISSDYAGGIIGHGQTSTTTIRGCVFAGTINGVNGNRSNIGGIWGWSDSGTPTLQNCLEDGTYINIASMHPMGLQGGSGTITNCYYLNPQVGSPKNACTVSGAKQAYAFTTAPANLGELVKDYGMVKAYANGILVGGTYYVAPATITLADNADNSTTITGADGYVANVTLADRTLYKDGAWNTISLPFDVTIAGSPLAGATARALTSASISGTTLTLTFGDAVTTLEAGTPYIIKWASGDNIVSPVFSGVTIDSDMHPYDTAEESVTTDERVRFVGTYKSTAFNADDKSILLMGSENTLYYPTAGAGIGAQRAYFKIGSDGALLARRLTAFNIDFGDDETTGIISVHDSGFMVNGSDVWYTLDGRRLSAKPSRAGVYINNGKKVVIK